MSDVLTDLATHLDSVLSSLVMATNLFGNDMPDAPDVLATLYETPGGPPVETLGAASKAAVIVPRVQVQTRGAHDQSRALAREIHDQLILLTNQQVNSVYYLRVQPLQEPFFLRRDEKERVVFCFNVEVQRVAE